MTLKELRNSKELTQKEAAELAGISLRSYKQYENDISKRNSFKYRYLLDVVNKYNYLDETHGVLKVDKIKDIVNGIFDKEYQGKIEFCYLFGSYAKGYANETSDIDLCVSTNISGFDYFGLVEELRTKLHKKVDLLRLVDLKNNINLLTEILKDGIKIYG